MAHAIRVEVEISVIVDGNRKSSATSYRHVPVDISVREIYNRVAMDMMVAAHRCITPALDAFREKFGEKI